MQMEKNDCILILQEISLRTLKKFFKRYVKVIKLEMYVTYHGIVYG